MRINTLIIVGGLLCLAGTRATLAQTDVLSTLRQQEHAIKTTIASLQKSEAQLTAQISPALKSAFDKEIGDKQAVLATIQDKLTQAGAIQKAIAALKATEMAVQGHVSSAFMTSLENEIQAKEKALANLAGPPTDNAPAQRTAQAAPTEPPTPPENAEPSTGTAAPSANANAPQPTSPLGNAAKDKGQAPGVSGGTPPSARVPGAPGTQGPAAAAAPQTPASAAAPNQLIPCGDPPCIDQPFENMKSITGKVIEGTKDADIAVSVDQKPLTQKVVVQDDTFSVSVDAPLQQYHTVEVDLTNPDGTKGRGVLSVEAAAVCSDQPKVLPCLNQPHAGDPKVTGELAPDSTASIKINGKEEPGNPEVTPGNSTFSSFTKSLSAPLPESGQVEVIQSDPNGTTGPAPILPPAGASSARSYYTLGMAGADVTAASSANPEQQYFAEFRLTAPFRLGRQHCADQLDALESKCWAWFNPRIASIPAPSTAALNSLTSASSALSGLGNLKLDQITQSVELHGGFEVAVTEPREGIPFPVMEPASVSLSWIVGLGILTPFNPVTGSQEFDLVPSISSSNTGDVTSVLNQFNFPTATSPDQTSKELQNDYNRLFTTLNTNCGKTPTSGNSMTACTYTHVALVPPSRSRFYRSWSTGVRIKTTFFQDYDKGNTCSNNWLSDAHRCVPAAIFPGTIDLALGQDESVTGGLLRHFVFTLDANYPFPGVPWLRIFGTAHVALERNLNIPTLVLLPTQTPVPINSSSVIVQPVPQFDRDYFRIGFGIDILKAFQSITQKQSQGQGQRQSSTGGNQ